MSWIQRLEEHSVWGETDRLLERISQTPNDHAGSVDPHHKDNEEQLAAMLRNLSVLRKELDPSVDLVILNDLANEIVQLASYYENYGVIDTPDRFQSLAALIRSMPVPARARLAGLYKQADNLEQKVKTLEKHSENAAALIGRVEELVAERTEKSIAQNLDRVLAQSEATASELSNRTNSIADQLNRFEGSLESAQQTIASQTARLDSALNDLESRYRAAEDGRNETWSEKTAILQSELSNHKLSIDQIESDAEKLLGSIAIDSTASQYGAYAMEQGRAANFWRWTAVGAFGGAAVWLVVTTIGWLPLPEIVGSDWWVPLLARWGGTGALIALGIYANSESSSHRSEERDAKQVELSLAALSPFVATLEDTLQQKLKEETARAIFVLDRKDRRSTRFSKRTNQGSKSSVESLVSLASDLSQKIPRS